MKNSGNKATNYLDSLLKDQEITIKTDKFDLYGRVLCYLYVNDVNINEKMISSNLVFKYDGGTKMTLRQ